MYARRISQNLVPTGAPNLKSLVSEQCCEHLASKYSLSVRRHFSECRNVKDLKSKLEIIVSKAKLYQEMLFSTQTPETTLKVWARQLEFVFAQRVRRGQQMFCLYSKWWEERALKEFLKKFRTSLGRNGKEFLIGATGVSLFNWQEKRISDDELQKHLDDMKYIEDLKDATMCLSCAKGEKSNKNTRLCECGSGGVSTKTYDDWVPFIEKDDLIVWRRPIKDSPLFEYKVFGSYFDVTAEDFLNAQIDTEYRKEWDTTAAKLEVGEKDPDPESNSDILYWEMQWPRLFVNRDYVFNRRYKVFEDAQMIIIINQTTEYSRFPKYPDRYRVEEYWSCMVIKPYEDMQKEGITFSLTYFDNPGVNIPSSVTSWVARSAMPDFLSKQRNASKNYKDYCLRKGTSKACEIYKEADRLRREEEERNRLDYCANERLSVILTDIFEDIQRKANEKFLKNSETLKSGSSEKLDKTSSTSPEETQPPQITSNSPKQANDTFWKYLHPKYYFT